MAQIDASDLADWMTADSAAALGRWGQVRRTPLGVGLAASVVTGYGYEECSNTIMYVQ